ncbi:hypothetical protein BJ138DRAFT_1018407, partial [Hygrophoropsis aurantiaca]
NHVATHRTRYTNAHLPAGVFIENRWRGQFIPTVTYFAGGYHDPFVIRKDDAIAALTAIWKAVYKTAPPADIDGAVYAVTKQRLAEWRSGFGSAAIAMLANLFTDADINQEIGRRVFADSLLDNNDFLYANPGAKTGRGLFRSPLILQIFASHFIAIRGHAYVSPQLGIEASQFNAKGALALSVTSTEYALRLAAEGNLKFDEEGDSVSVKGKRKKLAAVATTLNKSTGKESKTATGFNEGNWGTIAQKYMVSVNNLSDDSFNAIVDAAQHIARSNNRGRQSTTTAGGDDEEEDARALLIDECNVFPTV